MMFLFSNLRARDSRTLPGSARASRAVSGALAENFLGNNCLLALAPLFEISTSEAARRGRRAEHARRMRSQIS
jgi:hypothetical protein